MSKTIAASTASPYRLSTGNGVYLDDLRRVFEQQNYTFHRIADCYLQATTSPAAWGTSGSEPATHNTIFPTTATTALTYQTQAKLNADGALVFFEVFVDVGAGSDIDVSLAFGSATLVLNFSTSGPQSLSGTIARGTIGSGWQTLKINLRTNTVGSADSDLVFFRIEDQVYSSAALMPDPTQ